MGRDDLSFAKKIRLLKGFSWHPSAAAATGIVARLPDPLKAGGQITRYRSLRGLSVAQVKVIIKELAAWRERTGGELWPSWPDVSSKTAASLRDTPTGVSCYETWSRSRNGQKYSGIVVVAYWQDYSQPRTESGRFKQSRRVWHLPINASNADVNAVIAEATRLREKMTCKLIKPRR